MKTFVSSSIEVYFYPSMLELDESSQTKSHPPKNTKLMHLDMNENKQLSKEKIHRGEGELMEKLLGKNSSTVVLVVSAH